MNVHTEAILRSLGLFLALYFTIKWGEASTPEYDTGLMILAIVLAVGLNLKPK